MGATSILDSCPLNSPPPFSEPKFKEGGELREKSERKEMLYLQNFVNFLKEKILKIFYIHVSTNNNLCTRCVLQLIGKNSENEGDPRKQLDASKSGLQRA